MLHNRKRVGCFASPERRQAWCLALCLLILSIAPLGAARQGKADAEVAPKRLQTAAGCLVAARFVQQDDLTYLGLKVGDLASASIPNWITSGNGTHSRSLQRSPLLCRWSERNVAVCRSE